jgi:CheY-like chemotaxis protein
MGKPARILVVEDDTAMRELLDSYLMRQGYDVIDACDSDVALRVLQSDEQIDLLLTDIVMPGRHDGFGLGKQARRLRPGLKVLHVTGYPEQINANPMMARSGALMQKPVHRAELLGRVGELLCSWAVDQNDILRRMYEYWVEKARGRRLPDRKDLDPAEITDILPYLSILEVVGDEPRYRYRLLGTQVVEAIGFNPTNLFIDEACSEGDAAFLTGLLSEVCAKIQPLYAASAFRSGESGMSTERLLLPFTLGSAQSRQIVVVQTFDWAQRTFTFHELARRHPDRTDAIQRPGTE